MSSSRIDFDTLPWETPAPGLRVKTAAAGSHKIRLLELSGRDIEHDWCETGHVGYVLEGVLEIVFADRVERFSSGDGLWIGPGRRERHRPRVISGSAGESAGDCVRLVLFEEA